MLTLTFTHAHSHASKTLSSLLCFFVLTLNIQLSSSLSSFQFIPHQSVLTYCQPTGEVSHDTQDADTKISYLIYLGSVYMCQSLFLFSCLPLTYTLSWAPAVLIGDTDTWLLHLLFFFCCNVYSYSPPISTQLCVNVTLPQSFLLGVANLEFDQLCCQWNITQIQYNNKS